MPKFVLSIVMAGLPLAAAAQQDSPAVDPAAVLRELDAIETKSNQSMEAGKQAVLRQLQAALASPSAAVNFYEQAVAATQFEGRRNDSGAFKDWKKERSEALRSNEMEAALLFHLRYLFLSLQRAAAKDAELEALAKNSLAYARDLAAAGDLSGKENNAPRRRDQGAENLLKQSLKESVFVRWLNLESQLPEAKSWELVPGNLAGILDKNVRSVLREKKSPALIDVWDLQIKVEADHATQTRLQHEAGQFNTVRKPALQFERARDLALLGLKNKAIAEMLVLAKTYPKHPDFPAWSKEIRSLVKSSPDAAPSTSP